MAELLGLHSVIGFMGDTPGGLIVHPDGHTLIHPLGSTVVIKDKNDPRSQEFLQGHTDKISCLAVSSSGRYLATGQVTYMGFTADIIIWDLENRQLLHRLSLHKVKVQALDFSHDEQYLVSLGGQDDNSLVLWEVQTGTAVCGSPAHNNFVLSVKFFNHRHDKLVTAGNYNLQLWEYDKPNNKLRPSAVQLGQLQRIFNCLTVNSTDEFVYVGTGTGDILQIGVETKLFRNSGPGKNLISLGVTAVAEAPNGDLIFGGGDGTVGIMSTLCPSQSKSPKQIKPLPLLASLTVEGAVTTVAIDRANCNGKINSFFVGTAACNVYHVTFDPATKKLTDQLLQTAHKDRINGLAFPHEYSEVFATCGFAQIRVWHLSACRELLRINVPNLECSCVTFSQDGSAIIGGWSDGKIRAFGPQSGKLLWTINGAHHKAVTAVAVTGDCTKLVSGGEEGLVRVWRLARDSQTMEASMKDHKGAINCIKINAKDTECVSASSDGSCIIWDLTTFKRRISMFSNTFFMSVIYHPDESQLVTTGTDRKIAYWDAYDGGTIRIVDASDSECVNALAIDTEGHAIISGGSDKLVKLWGYDEGHCYFVGHAHSGAVTSVAVTPDKTKIVSVGTEGGIFMWDYRPPQTLAEL